MATDLTPESRLSSTLHAAMRRRRFQLLIHHTSRTLIISSIIALLLLIADRMFAIQFSEFLIITIAALGLPVGLFLGWRIHISSHDIALILDDTYHLNNRISTALDLTESSTIQSSKYKTHPETLAFSELTLLDATQSCNHINIKNTFPVRWARSSSYAIALTITLIAGIIWCPDWSAWIINPDQNEQLLARQEDQLAAAQAIRQAEQNMRNLSETLAPKENNTLNDSAETHDETEQVIQTLHDLSSQLTNTEPDSKTKSSDSTKDENTPPAPRTTVAEAAQTLNELAQNLDDTATEDQHIADTLLNRLNQIAEPQSENISNPESNTSPESLQQLTQALKQNDTQKTIDEINRLQRDLQNKSPQEKQQLAQNIRKLAQQLSPDKTKPDNSNNENPNDTNQENPDNANENNQSSPQNKTQPKQEPEEQSTPDQQIKNTEEQLKQDGLDPETAREIAEKQHDRAQADKAKRKADQELKKTAEELRRWADELEKQNTNSNKLNSQQPPLPETDHTPPNQKQPAADSDNPAQQSQPNAKPDSQQTTNKDTQSQIRKDNQQPDTNNSEDQPSQTITRKENAEEKTPKTQNEISHQDSQSQEQSYKEQPSPNTKQQNNQQPNTQSPQSKDQISQQQQDSNQPSTTPSETMRRLQEAVRRMGSHEKQAAQNRTVSEEAKKQAQQLIEKMTPDQKDQLKRWMEKQGNPENTNQQPTEENKQNPSAQPAPTPSTPPNLTGNNPMGKPQSSNAAPQTNPSTSEQSPYQYTIRDIDARNNDQTENRKSPNSDDNRVLSEWLRNNSKTPDNRNPSTTTRPYTRQLAPTAIKQATRAAQRALDEEAVAPRYRNLLKKWTDQLSKELKKLNNNTVKSDNPSPTNTSNNNDK